MQDNKMINYVKDVLKNMPDGWLKTTTHRLDIYDEKLAKTQFLDEFEKLYNTNNLKTSELEKLPTAYDYIRLGHPLSCVLEWSIAKLNTIHSENVISFSSHTMPILAILRKNSLENRNTQIVYTDTLPSSFDTEILKTIYGYSFELKQVENSDTVAAFEGSTIFVGAQEAVLKLNPNIDFYVFGFSGLGSVVVVNGKKNKSYISEIQHVRRRETIAMTPSNCHVALNVLLENTDFDTNKSTISTNKSVVLDAIKKVTGTVSKPLVGSSGLSIQYAIMMGAIHDTAENHKGKAIKFIVPPNCYGGTNDQARRVAASLQHVEIVDLPVDGTNDMVKSLEIILEKIAAEDAIPFIIAEIPTNPRVEVPDLEKLKEVLSKKRVTSNGGEAVDSVFILDQTFCPNVLFLGENKILSEVKALSYASGSKFPSGGKCNAGYVVGNKKVDALMEKIEQHLMLCDNEATNLQFEILAQQLPSMNERIAAAYKNTQEFVNYIHEVLPTAKINFVSEELVNQGFTPSVFSLDLPTKGTTTEEKENYKRALNHKLIDLMITKIPNESKYCVSYGQLKGCYWTIPATSTQGTTKEGDKDYIARVSLSGNMDLEMHKKVFSDFVAML
jgi:cystathionine beta-lyase/cystathionine gamma-synthase